jgi:hypothetical protein
VATLAPGAADLLGHRLASPSSSHVVVRGDLFEGRDHLVRPLAVGGVLALLGGLAGYLVSRSTTGFVVGAGVGGAAGFVAGVSR